MKFKAGLIAAVLVIATLSSIVWLSYVRSSRLGKVQAFHYQLQGYEPDFVIQHSHDHGTLTVIDGSRFSHDEVEKLKNQGRNTVLAALAVAPVTGEYWAPEWQKTAKVSISRITDAGFDGVYLLGVDAYHRHADRPTAAGDMVEWIGRIASAGRKSSRRFIVMHENAACITDVTNFPGADDKEYSGLNSLYLASIDGASVEFGGEQPEQLQCVQALQNHHKRVFGFTAVTDPGRQARLLDEMSGHGITGTVFKR